MEQRLSRPERWRIATSRGIRAISVLRDLQSSWMMKLQELRNELENLRDEQTNMAQMLEEALAELIYLQSEYNCWSVPENLSDSRLQSKLNDVQSFSFRTQFDRVQELTKLPLEDQLEAVIDSLDDPYQEANGILYEAKEFDLPKGYGRD